jgi:hypothetical protein
LQQRQLLSANDASVDKYLSQISRLEKQLQESHDAKTQQQLDCDLKIAKMQGFFDKELEVLKASQHASSEERYRLLEQQLETLKKDAILQQENSKRQLDDLTNRLTASEKCNAELTDHSRLLERNLKDKVSEAELLSQTVFFIFIFFCMFFYYNYHI